jgi:hypothetical protein
MATQVTLNNGSIDSAGSLALKTNGTTTAVTIDTSQRAAFVAGTAALPAITTTGDTNTGIFFPAADTIAFSEGGVESMRIDSSGNVGIGTASPGAQLEVSRSSTSGYSTFRLSNSGASGKTYEIGVGGNAAAAGYANNLYFYDSTASAIRMVLDTSGNVGIGTSSPSGRLAVAATGGAGLIVGQSNDNFYASTNHRFYDLSYTNERARIDSSGNLLVGTTANIYTSRLNVKSSGDNNAAQFYRQGTTSASAIVIFNSNSGGTETLKSYIDTVSGLLVTTSDERLKENIVGIGYGLQQISALRPVSFEWINGDGKTNLGFIAQEVETVIPEAVTTLDESMSKSIDNQKMLDKDTLIPVLVKAIQEQQALITQLQADVAALKGASA